MNKRAIRYAGVSPSPLNGERAGVRGVNVEMNLDFIGSGAERSPSPHPALSPPSGSGEGLNPPARSLSNGPSFTS
jgi:hypothetical protein